MSEYLEFGTVEGAKLKSALMHRLTAARAKLEQDQTLEHTWRLRGEIAALRGLLEQRPEVQQPIRYSGIADRQALNRARGIA